MSRQSREPVNTSLQLIAVPSSRRLLFGTEATHQCPIQSHSSFEASRSISPPRSLGNVPHPLQSQFRGTCSASKIQEVALNAQEVVLELGFGPKFTSHWSSASLADASNWPTYSLGKSRLGRPPMSSPHEQTGNLAKPHMHVHACRPFSYTSSSSSQRDLLRFVKQKRKQEATVSHSGSFFTGTRPRNPLAWGTRLRALG